MHQHTQYDDRLFIELPVQYMKIASSEHGKNMLCTRIVFLVLFWHSEQLMYNGFGWSELKCVSCFCIEVACYLSNIVPAETLCQKLLYLHQLTHNMTRDCSLNYKFKTCKFQAQNMGRTCCVQKLFLTFWTIYVYSMISPCSAKIRA